MKFYTFENQTEGSTVTPSLPEWTDIDARVWMSGFALYESLRRGRQTLRRPSLNSRFGADARAFATVHHGLLLARYRPRTDTSPYLSDFVPKQERANGLLGTFSVYTKGNPHLFYPAAWKVDWANNTIAQQTVYALVQDDALRGIPYDMLLAGLLTDMPADDFPSLLGLPADLTQELTTSMILTALDGLTLDDFGWTYEKELASRSFLRDKNWLQQMAGWFK